jgi:hypothetical protein
MQTNIKKDTDWFDEDYLRYEQASLDRWERLREDKDVLVKKVVYSAFEFREDVL